MANLILQLKNYRLTTAEIIYHLPDHPALLQSYVWQEYDLAPHFPELSRFLDFWSRELEGKLHSVKVGAKTLITPEEIRMSSSEFLLH
ncbi:MAG: usg protein [Alphaproteobacteria bacterium]|nr:usg protein [Alphaproteobacteria bacterium]